MRRFVPPVALWLVCAAILAVITSRVADWFVMTDELLYERLALSGDRLRSPVPHVHRFVVGSISQLYPLLLAPIFASRTVAQGLQLAHVLNAFVMLSAAIPAYLLARRVTCDTRASLFAALLTAIVPWIVLSSFLLTEVAAYPAFLWALLAFHVALTEPRPRHDLVAVSALVVAVVARTQFAVLAAALPGAILLAGRWRAHRTLGLAYLAGAVLALVVVATGHSVLGTYGSTTSGNPVPASIAPAFFSHLAVLALGLGLVPFVIGGAWLVRREPFAMLASVTIVLLTLEVASYDLRFGGGLVRDRYLFYAAPLFAIACAAALARWASPRWSLAVPTGVLVAGFATAPLPVFEKLNVDTPVSIVDGYLRREVGGLGGARTFLVVAGVLAALLVVEAGLLLGRSAALALAACALLLVTAETGYAFERLFRLDGTAGRPLTVDPSGQLGWIDRAVGRGANVTLVPFPTITGEYFTNAAYWWDAEFWNVSATRSAGIPGRFEWTPSTFPKLALRFDRVGRADATAPGFVLQAVGDTRFHLAGTVVTNNRRAFLVKPEQPWRADWTTTGLYDDGWTRPDAVARVQVYPYPGQQRRVLRQLTVSVFAPNGVSARRFTVGPKSAVVRDNEVSVTTNVCVPPRAAGTVDVRVDGASRIANDPNTQETFAEPRNGGVQISRIYLSGQIGAAC
ncbi:MAG TPA: glycosyltransferase family 39 protein [Gaiellaceae bacterium]|nr:glycosyltransferase family 39 protein [Gaiellaceae bacterium]